MFPSLDQYIDTFVDMSANTSIAISKVYTNKKKPEGLQDLIVHSYEVEVGKIGIAGRKHVINSDISAKEATQKYMMIKDLKVLVEKKKLVKEIEAAVFSF